MPGNKIVYIFNVGIAGVSYESLINLIDNTIKENGKKIIGYATVHNLNIIYLNPHIREIFNKFDLIHPDGIGVFLGSRFLYKKSGFMKRMTGSDFYPVLINESIKNKWNLFLFGEKEEILKKVNIDNLNVVGKISGYNFNTEDVILSINNSGTDILLVGLGCPLQEEWIVNNKEKLNAKIILAVGEGIKVLAGVKKRGPVFLRSLGLEWVTRLILNPKKLWNRYVFGIPLFIYRIIKYKFHTIQL